MRPSTRLLLAAFPLLAACAANSDERVGTTAGAVNPEQSINTETFTFTLSGLQVSQDNGGGTIYAGLGAILDTQPETAEGCSLGKWGGPGTAALGVCKDGGTNNVMQGAYVQQIVTVTQETEMVHLGIVLDDTGVNAPQLSASNLGTELNIAGNWASTAGALIGAVGGPVGGAIGGIVGAIGAVLSLFGTNIGDTGATQTSIPCNGGLIGSPKTPWSAEYKITSGNSSWYWGEPNAPLDTMTESFSVPQLEALTAAGPATISYPVGVQWPAAFNGLPIYLQGDGAGYCNSAMTLQLTIQRGNPTLPSLDGPAADPLSSSTGVARLSTELDGLVVDQGHDALVNMQWAPNGWAPGLATQSVYATSSYTPTATLSRNLPPPGSAMQLIPPPVGSAPSVPGTTNLSWDVDSFWFDQNAQLYWTNWQQATGWKTTPLATGGYGNANGQLAATSRTPNDMDVFWVDSLGRLNDLSYAGFWNSAPTQVVSGLPLRAHLATVSRAYNAIDVLYINTNGVFTDANYTYYPAGGYGQWSVKTYGNAVAPAGSFITAAARDANTIDAFFVGNGGLVYQAHYAYGAVNGQSGGTTGQSSAPWNAPAPTGLTGTTGAPISAASRTQSSIDLVYLSGSSIEYASNNVPNSTAWAPAVTITGTGSVSPTASLSLVAMDQYNLGLYYFDPFNGSHGARWTQGNATNTWSLAEPALPTWKWQGWDTVSGGLVSDPSIASPNANEVVTAATGPDGTIWYATHTASSPSWSGWKSLGNAGHAFTDAPALVAVNGMLEVFVRDPVTQTMMHQEGYCESLTSCSSPSWNQDDWEELNYLGYLATPLPPTTFIAGTPTVVVSQPSNQINVFATGTDGAAHVITGTGYGQMGVVKIWEGPPGGYGYWLTVGKGSWTNLAGGVYDEPAATTWGSDRLDVFVRGLDSTLWHRWSTDNGVTWNPTNNNWEGRGGLTMTTPVAASDGNEQLEVVAAASNGGLSHWNFNGTAWSYEEVAGVPGGISTSGHPTMIAHGTSTSVYALWALDVFAQSAGGSLYTMSKTVGGAWSGWEGMNECYRGASAPAVVSRDGANLDLVINAQNGDASIWHDSTAGTFYEQNWTVPPLACQQPM